MTPCEQAAIQQAISGIDTALVWLDADIRRLVAALEAGISLEVIGELNRIIYRAQP